MFFKTNYFLSSFFWSFASKILNAVFGFVSVPLLLGYFGKADYGLLSIATACNGYMHIMDMGVNTGAIKFFSQWNADGRRDLIQKVANTNISFYLIISIVNILGLLGLAWFGESFFSVSHEQFLQLRICFYILAIFSSVSWVTSAYTQLLTAYKKIAFTMKVNCVMILLRFSLIIVVLTKGMSLSEYFFCLTALLAAVVIPNIAKCKKDKLIDSLKPALHWKEFRLVVTFSLSIFAMSLFQTTAIQSRPIILSIFAENGADVVADYRIIEVFPIFIVMLCGSFTGIFLPKSSEMLVKNTNDEIQSFVNKWTVKTTALVCILCFPFIIAGEDVLSAYVGSEYAYLGKWLRLWCFFLIFQMHSTPAFSFVLAKGKTKALVTAIAIAAILSMTINIILCKNIPVGSAVIGYVVYMICQVCVDYIYVYKYYVGLRRLQILKSFLLPLLVGLITCIIPYLIPLEGLNFFAVEKINFFITFMIKGIIWFIPYMCLLFVFRILKFSDFSLR